METKMSSYLNLVKIFFVCWVTLMLFSVFTPAGLRASPDQYEPDNTWENARIIPLNNQNPFTQQIPGYDWFQSRNFYNVNDEDCVKFYAIKGETYKIVAKCISENCDTAIEVYDIHGQNLIRQADNYSVPGDQPEYVEWECTFEGFYYARITLCGPGTEGCEASCGEGTEYLKVSRNFISVL